MVEKQRMKLSVLHTRFLSDLRTLGRSKGTLDAYHCDFNNLLKFLPRDDTRLFTLKDLADFPGWLSEQGKQVNSICRHLAGLSSFGDWLVERGDLPFNPLDRIRRPKKKTKNPNPVPTPHANQLLAIQDPRARALFSLMRYAGLRIREVVALDLEDVTQSHVRIRDGKGGTDASVPTAAPLWSALQAWIQVRGEAPGALFPGVRAPRTSKRKVWEALKRACIALGLPHYNPHRLRHTNGTELIRAGVPLAHAQKLMRHASPETTMGYVRVEASDLVASMGKAEELWGKT